MSQTLANLADALARGATTARALVEDSLSRIADPNGEGARAFIRVATERARREADGIDAARKAGAPLPRLAGAPIGVKDLFDVAGETTTAGSRILADAAPARADAPAVARVRRAGFIVVGRTNMTEFAYSGLGVNPHYGTPLNPWDRARGRAPGGSSSGTAVAVADGMVPVALGTDTGGSCRIPAAFCGVVGFKPTQARVPLGGAFPLAPSLDSIGPFANDVASAASLDDILAGGLGEAPEPFPLAGLRVGILEGYVDQGLDAEVAAAYEAALSRLAGRGARLIAMRLPELAELPEVNRNGPLGEFEAFAVHRALLAEKAAGYDPWVRQRIEGGRGKLAADYIDLLAHRARIRAATDARTAAVDVCALPAVAVLPPALADLVDAERARAINGKILRNTATGNFLDRPAISIPCHAAGEPPVGFMLMGETGGDKRLLAIARGAEATIRGD